MSIVRSVATQIVIVVAVLVCTEVFLRVADFRDIRVVPEKFQLPYDYDPELAWYPVPGRPTGLGDRINSMGLRDIELVDNSRSRPTILFMGDSFVYGNGVKAGDRFTNVLRRELPQFRIVNAGVAAYGTDQEYLLLRRLWPRIKPSIVVLIVCEDNDHLDNSTNSRYGHTLKPYLAKVDGRWQFLGIPPPHNYRWYFDHNWFAHNIALVRLALDAYAYTFHPAVTVPDPTNQLVKMMQEFVEQHGAKFLVGLQYADPKLEPFLVVRKIPYTRFDGAPTLPNDDHWNPQGHAMVAERLKKLFAVQHLLDTEGDREATQSGERR
jgi:hypothetical protein